MKPVSDKKIDAELFDRFTAGEEAAFREIVSRYKNGLKIRLRRPFLSMLIKPGLYRYYAFL
jgi:hypothetical protein